MIGTREGNEETQQFEQSDHLDPQPAASVLANKSPSVMSRSDSRTSLNNLNKEEGSVLKLAKLRDFHSPNSPYPESTGEELRNKLMSVELADLDKVIDFLSDLKRREFRWKKFSSVTRIRVQMIMKKVYLTLNISNPFAETIC